MIRRDYILRMIEEFVRALARINAAKQRQKWDEASGDLDTEFKRLAGINALEAAQMSESELLARVVRGEPTHLVRDKILMLTTLLKESGDVALAQDQSEKAHACHLKSLHLLLDTLGRGEIFECPEFVPKVEMLVTALQVTTLARGTHAMLMRHYERTGEFARAEDALFALLEAEPDNNVIIEFGVIFYQRLLGQSDATLSAGALPRTEVEEGLRGLQGRQKHETGG